MRKGVSKVKKVNLTTSTLSDTDPRSAIFFSLTPVEEIKVQGELEEYLCLWGFGILLIDITEGPQLIDEGLKNPDFLLDGSSNDQVTRSSNSDHKYRF